MELELIIRLTLIFLGIFFIILSAAGAILEMARQSQGLEGLSSNPLDGITKLIQALGKYFEMLGKAPLWLGLGGFGVLLILLGALLPLNLT